MAYELEKHCQERQDQVERRLALARAARLGDSVLGQGEALDDAVRDHRRRRTDVDANRRLVVRRFLEIVELALQKGRRHEVPVARSQAGGDLRLRPGEVDKENAAALPVDEIAV